MAEGKLIYLARVQEKRRTQTEQRARELAQFTNVDELNCNVDRFIDEHGFEFSETALILLAVLAQHSCVVPGVSWLSVPSIAQHVGVSERTVQTALRTLENAGIIARVPETDSRGGRVANFIVIQPYAAAEEDITEVHFTGGITEANTTVFTQNLVNLSEPKNEDDYNTYRTKQFFEIGHEWGIPRKCLHELYEASKDQINTTSWIALEITFGKMIKHSNTISKVTSWFVQTLRNENILQQIATGQRKLG